MCRIGRKSLFWRLCFSLALLLGDLLPAITMVMAEEPMYQISASNLQTLKRTLSGQETDLMTLQEILTMLETSNAEQQSQIVKLQEDCKTLEQQIGRTQEALNAAKISLEECRNEIGRLQKSLDVLKDQVQNLQRENESLIRQRNTWRVIAIALGGSWIIKEVVNH